MIEMTDEQFENLMRRLERLASALDRILAAIPPEQRPLTEDEQIERLRRATFTDSAVSL